MLCSMASRHRIWAGVVCGLAGCAAPAEGLPPQVIWQEQAWQDLDAAKETVAGSKGEPRVVHFPGHGEITVRDWYLEGFPENAYVRAKFTYENTTGRELDYVTVWLTVMDVDGNPVARQWTDLFMPMALAFPAGSMFADELRTQTRDVHRDPRGWHWALGCEAVFKDGQPAEVIYPGEAFVAPNKPFSSWISGR